MRTALELTAMEKSKDKKSSLKPKEAGRWVDDIQKKTATITRHVSQRLLRKNDSALKLVGSTETAGEGGEDEADEEEGVQEQTPKGEGGASKEEGEKRKAYDAPAPKQKAAKPTATASEGADEAASEPKAKVKAEAKGKGAATAKAKAAAAADDDDTANDHEYGSDKDRRGTKHKRPLVAQQGKHQRQGAVQELSRNCPVPGSSCRRSA